MAETQPQGKTLKGKEKMAATNDATPYWEKPTLATKLAWASPSLMVGMINAPIAIELNIFYTDTVLVPAGLLALAMAIGRAFDAITDPLMGWISDNTQSRWGRRKHWIPLGVPLCTLCFWLMFIPPESLSPEKGAVLWGGLTFSFYFLFYTVWNVPYQGLGMELTPDYDDRSTIFGLRSIFGGFGITIGFATLVLVRQYELFSDTRTMLSMLTGSYAIVWALIFLFPLFKIKENPHFQGRKGVPLAPGIRRALRNRPFRIILIVVVIGNITSGMPPLLMPFFAKYIIRLGDMWRVVFAGVYTFSGFLSLPVWMWIARRFGKLQTWISAAIVGIIGCSLMFTVGEGQIVKMCIFEFIHGFASGAMMFLGGAILADIIDYDELRTGKRREAQYGSFMGLLPKFIGIVSGTLPLAVLGAAGYDPSITGVENMPTGIIRIMFALLPAIFSAITIFLILRYPISREVHGKIREGVDRHRQGEDALDPITGKTLHPPDTQAVDENTAWFLDNFSVSELKSVMDRGIDGFVSRVKFPVFRWAVICIGTILSTFWILFGHMSRSQGDQLRQGIGAALIVFGGIALTLMVYNILRIRPAKKMIADPIDAEIIRNHLSSL